MRIALYHRQPAVLEALLAAQPPLDGLDHAALGWADDLRRDVAAGPGARLAALGRRLHGAALRLLLRRRRGDRGAARGRRRPERRGGRTRRACGRCTPPPPRATPSRRGCCSRPAPTPTRARPAASPRCRRPRTHDDDALAALLLRHGADPSLRNDEGADAAGIARANESAAVLALLGAPTAERAQPPKWTLPFERARACARSTKSSRLIAPRNRRATSLSRAVSERRSSSPCLASIPNSTVAAIS